MVYINDILKMLNTHTKKEVVTFRCKPVVLEYLKEIAEEKNMSLSCLIDIIVTDYVEKIL